MSYTEIVGFNKEGNAYSQADIHNAFRGAMAIWRAMEEKYLTVGRFSRCVMGNEKDMREIWDLAGSNKVSENDKICLASTFDNVVVKRKDFQKVITAFREFDAETSLKEQADVLEEMLADEDCIAVAWNQTSVNKNTWLSGGGYDEKTDDYIPYNLNGGERHFYMFDESEEKDNV